MGKSTISMTIFNSYVKLPEGKTGLGKRPNLSHTLGTIGDIISNKYLKTQNLHGTFTKPCKSGDLVPNKNKLRVFSFQNKWRNISDLNWNRRFSPRKMEKSPELSWNKLVQKKQKVGGVEIGVHKQHGLWSGNTTTQIYSERLQLTNMGICRQAWEKKGCTTYLSFWQGLTFHPIGGKLVPPCLIDVAKRSSRLNTQSGCSCNIH